MPNRRALFIALALLVALVVALTLYTATVIVPPRDLRFDFTPRWVGGRAVWAGQSPYTPQVTADIQTLMFGGVLPPDADQQRMAYPAYTALVLAPLLPLPPQTAAALWMTLQLVAVLITPVLWLAVLRWKPHPFVLALLTLGLTFAFRYPINLYIIGQFTGTMLFGLTVAVWLLARKHDTAAGIVLALITVPPTIAAPLALLILGALCVVGRWRGLAAFILTLGSMTLATFALIGWWIPEWIAQVRDYPGYAQPIWAAGLLPLLARPLLFAAVAGTATWVLWRFRLSSNMATLIDLVIAALLAALLFMPQTGNYYLVLLIAPLVVVFYRAGKLRGGWLVAVLAVLAVLSPWLYLAGREAFPQAEHLLLPLHVALVWGATLVMPARTGSASPPSTP